MPLRAAVREQGLAQRMLKGSAMAAENQGDKVHCGAIRQKETRDADSCFWSGHVQPQPVWAVQEHLNLQIELSNSSHYVKTKKQK